MKVEKFYTRYVVGIRRSASLVDAALLMKNYHVGALLVTDDPPCDSRTIGIVTDRDLVLNAMAGGLAPAEVCVGDIMSPDPGTISASEEIDDAIDLMRFGGYRRLAVTDEHGDIVGMLSLDDVVQALAADLVSVASLLQLERAREREKRAAALA